MCKVLGVSRSNYYYEINLITTEIETNEDKLVIEIFETSKGHYGARKIKVELLKQGIIMSRKKI